jgi:hypothetical protein
MQTVIETAEFIRRAKACDVTEDERAEMVNFIAAHPQAGNEIKGTGGARKVRFARPGGGKSGGYRVITFYSGVDIPVFLLSLFAKNEKTDVTPKERNALKKVLPQVVKDYQARSKLS